MRFNPFLCSGVLRASALLWDPDHLDLLTAVGLNGIRNSQYAQEHVVEALNIKDDTVTIQSTYVSLCVLISPVEDTKNKRNEKV